jgi:hypothetical protein
MSEPFLPRELESLVAIFESHMKEAGAYMPTLATRLRIIADQMAGKYPDSINGGYEIELIRYGDIDAADPSSAFFDPELADAVIAERKGGAA